MEETGKPVLVVLGVGGSGTDEYGSTAGNVISRARTDLIAAALRLPSHADSLGRPR